jgi:peptidoglycan/xylan/chitin deacetylase (PgdA/CDA1 family)
MRGKKKLMSLLLISVLGITTALSGCGNSEQDVAATPSVNPSTEATTQAAATDDSHMITVTVPSPDGATTAAGNGGQAGGGESSSAESSEAGTTAAGGQTDVKAIALTFDDGPYTYKNVTNRIVDALEKNNAKATFFVVGQAVNEWFPTDGPEVMKKAVSIGCEIGTHTYSHENLNTSSSDVIKEQVEKGCKAIEDVTGQKVTLMRPPYGNAKQSVMDQVDLPMIQWDIDTLDWDTKDADNTVKVILEQAKPGSIILMHDIYGASAEAAERVIPELIKQGYQLVTVSELFEIYGKELEPHHQYYDARGDRDIES